MEGGCWKDIKAHTEAAILNCVQLSPECLYSVHQRLHFTYGRLGYCNVSMGPLPHLEENEL